MSETDGTTARIDFMWRGTKDHYTEAAAVEIWEEPVK
jgi:hypothetical protein